MAYDEGLAQVLRDDLSGVDVTEKKMFGGLAFMHRGHMLCGLYQGGLMFRVGKPNEAAALAQPGVRMLTQGGRAKAGLVETGAELADDDAAREALIALALDFNRSQPPK